jgi:signal peptidase I
MKKKLWFWLVLAAVLIVALIPSYVRVYRVEGCSDAPSFLVGDRVLLFKAAYDVRFPYTGTVLWTRSDPRPGDVVMYSPPGQDISVFKRVVACPGDTVAMRNNRMLINGTVLQYEKADPDQYRAVAATNRLGDVMEKESGHGAPRVITYTPGAAGRSTFADVILAEGQYFVLGDNRDNSLDSRMYGPIRREAIIGRVAK